MSDKQYAVVCVDNMRDWLDKKEGATETAAVTGPFESLADAQVRVWEISSIRMCWSEHRIIEVSGV